MNAAIPLGSWVTTVPMPQYLANATVSKYLPSLGLKGKYRTKNTQTPCTSLWGGSSAAQ